MVRLLGVKGRGSLPFRASSSVDVSSTIETSAFGNLLKQMLPAKMRKFPPEWLAIR